MSLIYVPDSSAQWNLTQAQYDALVAKMKADPEASNLDVTMSVGSVTYEKIDFSWHYDDPGVLTVTITGNRNWKAKLAGSQTVLQQLNDKLISQV
jgi:hypothetical protein